MPLQVDYMKDLVVLEHLTMRLLRMDKDGSLSVISFVDTEVPNYATLSHTWRGDNEATFQDVTNHESLSEAAAANIPGFDKLLFCGKQAHKDSLQYFWVDTCCINKSSSAELSEAINSMFRWYQYSNKCYVLLTDVSVHPGNTDLVYRDDQLRRSRWFQRGWTLQELLAPSSVQFFSREGNLLGTKQTLEKTLADITGIPVSALRGTPLSFYDFNEKLSWAAARQTKHPEDRAYSLLGMFDVHIPAMYGEGETYALHRLQSEIERRWKQGSPGGGSNTNKPVNQWAVPFERNPRFTDRDSELVQLEQMLYHSDSFAKVAVSGLGGVGKTQLILELLYRIKEKRGDYTALWIPATTAESLDQGYHAVAQKLGIMAGSKESNVKKMIQDWLSSERSGNWVLVYDNADDMDLWVDSSVSGTRMIDYLPQNKHGRVIFTTRNRKLGVKVAHQSVMELSSMTDDAAIRMLRKSLIHPDVVDSHLEEAVALVQQLTHLPLAISQAAAYINENGIMLGDYLELVNAQEDEVIELLTEEFEDDARYTDIRNPVATTWLISFEQIRSRDSLAADYLSFMACIDHKEIPQLLMPAGPSRKKEIEAIGTLTAYSFVTKHMGSSAFDMHRLVHLTQSDSSTNLQWKIALCFYSDGRFIEAEAFFKEVMNFRIATLGEEHPDTLQTMSKLALTYHAQSRFPEAQQLGLKAMEGQQRVLGEESADTLSTMSHLSMTYSDLSQWKEAEALELKTMEIRHRVLGEEHPDTLVGMSNLVYLYNCQGWWEQAEELGKRTTTARKKVLGTEHPDTLLSIGNLAHTYNNQGRYKDAEELLAYVVDIRTKLLGKNHPHTLSGMSNLAVSYHNQGRLEEAETLQMETVVARRTLLGDEHFSTLTSMSHLASTYHRQHRLSEAEDLCIQVMQLRKKVLGADHHHTLTSMTTLATIYQDDGQYGKAEELWLQVLAIRIKVLGIDHNQSIACMESLTETYKLHGRTSEAEDLQRQIAELRESAK
ncbi:TPR-like protein [Sarocladium strictum]